MHYVVVSIYPADVCSPIQGPEIDGWSVSSTELMGDDIAKRFHHDTATRGCRVPYLMEGLEPDLAGKGQPATDEEPMSITSTVGFDKWIKELVLFRSSAG